MAAQQSGLDGVVPLSGCLFVFPDVVDVVSSQLVASNANDIQTPINSPPRHRRQRLTVIEERSIVNLLVHHVRKVYCSQLYHKCL